MHNWAGWWLRLVFKDVLLCLENGGVTSSYNHEPEATSPGHAIQELVVAFRRRVRTQHTDVTAERPAGRARVLTS